MESVGARRSSRVRQARGLFDPSQDTDNVTAQTRKNKNTEPPPATSKNKRGRASTAAPPPQTPAATAAPETPPPTTAAHETVSTPDLTQQTLLAILNRLNALEDAQTAKTIDTRNQNQNPGADNNKPGPSGEPPNKKNKGRAKVVARNTFHDRGDSDDEDSEAEEGEVSDESSGESSDEDDDDEVYTPFDDMIDDNLTKKLEKRILANKFVEFCDILPDLEHPQEEQYTMKLQQDKKGTLLTRKYNRKNLPFHLWQQAFQIFTTIYVGRAKTVKEAKQITRELATYLRNVTELKDKGYRWLAFDRSFRRKQSKKLKSWASIPLGLMLKYQSPRGSRSGGNRSFNFQPRSDIPRGYCFKYHSKGQYCESVDTCRYRHDCYKCHNQHVAYRCEGTQAKHTATNKHEQHRRPPPQGGMFNKRP